MNIAIVILLFFLFFLKQFVSNLIFNLRFLTVSTTRSESYTLKVFLKHAAIHALFTCLMGVWFASPGLVIFVCFLEFLARSIITMTVIAPRLGGRFSSLNDIQIVQLSNERKKLDSNVRTLMKDSNCTNEQLLVALFEKTDQFIESERLIKNNKLFWIVSEIEHFLYGLTYVVLAYILVSL